MSLPLVSVIIPTYNSEDTVREALRSVQEQTFTDYEVIVVDDASTDGTVECARSESSNLPNHRIIALVDNGGPAAARNKGVCGAKGKWIAFLDGDDVWLPWRLELQMDLAAEHGSIEMFCGGTAEMGQDVPEPPRRSGAPRFTRLSLADFAVRNEVATSTVLVRKRAVEEAGLLDTRFRGPEDYDLWMRIAARGDVLKVEAPLSRYREVAGSLSRDDRTFLPEVMRVLDKAYGEQGVLRALPAKRRAQAFQYLCAAWMAASRHARVRAWCLYARGVAKWPGSFKPYARLPGCRMRLLLGLLKQTCGSAASEV